ncbi:GTPase IMAP family member 8-like [Sardina pilchardus]|uniref:GTPase IMAP family member 8-like n=1 Tax=Sardina pilchardus TaxID=27697 RepID=UPI002E107A50
MLLGKNGAAKRILGNAILGRKAFPPKPEIAIIHQCRAKNGLALRERNVTVLDTLEILDTLDMAQRLNTCVHWVAPGPHLFLYVAEPGERACEGMRFVRRSLGRAAARFTVVVFGGGAHRREERRTEEDVRKELAKCFVGGYHIFGGDLSGNPGQIRALMVRMDAFMSDHMGYKAKINKT